VRFDGMRVLPLLFLATACAATGGSRPDGEAGLTRDLAGRAAGEPRDCVATSPGSMLVARGRQTLVYHRGDTIWVNRLKAECPGLDEFSQLIIEVQGSQYCRGDRFRTRHPGSSIPGPICILESFTPYRRPGR
jgi:hypothetical protein